MTSGSPKYETVEEMQAAIDEFFEDCQPKEVKDKDGQTVYDKNGNPAYELNPPTITGLALHLGFCSRQSMYDYEKKPDFSYTIKMARTKCEQFLEKHGLLGNVPPAMAIFGLKNYGWTDRQEITHNIPTVNLVVENAGTGSKD